MTAHYGIGTRVSMRVPGPRGPVYLPAIVTLVYPGTYGTRRYDVQTLGFAPVNFRNVCELQLTRSA